MASKSPMAVNKSQTPMWMRVVIILVVVSFAGAGLAVIVSSFVGGGGAQTPSGTGTSGVFAETYQPRVDAALVAAQASPQNPDVVIQVGHAYYEWAVEVYQSGQAAASIPFWLSAVTYYDQVLAIRPDDDIARGNKAFALFYGQSPDAAEALQLFVEQAADNAALSQQVENARGMLAQVQATPAPGGETTTTP